MPGGRLFAFVASALLVVGAACGASGTNSNRAATKRAAAETVSFPIASDAVPSGAKRIHLEVGPLTVKPGQNNISLVRRIPQPAEDGWIVGMSTNLRLADGTVPPVDVIHLHHGVWLDLSRHDATSALPERFFAAGEEKTIMHLPAGYGYPYKTSGKWLLNYMLHNQLSKPDQVWITYDIDLIPPDAPAAQGMKTARPVWMDVQNGSTYPVFDVVKGRGNASSYTYPDDASDPYRGATPKNQWSVDRDGVLLATAGHVHPGGLHDDLWLTRQGATAPTGHAKPGSGDTVRLFSSVADYFEPSGKVSWDVSMTGTPSTWRPAVHKGDVLSVTTTYDSKRASWYESMGIMVVWMSDDTAGGVNPFAKTVDVPGVLTHGHLPENNNHGGQPAPGDYQDLTKAPARVVPSGTVLPIADFAYQGDMSEAASVPAVAQGGTLTFQNEDASKDIWHTVTSCVAPCDQSTGIAYPLADAATQFDSGELGLGGPPAAGVTTWKTPSTLAPGTYTYFCRIHPFMRGVFRVVPKSS